MEPILWKEVGHLLFAHTRGPWKSVDKQKDLFHNYRGRELGNGGKTSFWNDSWIGRNSLEELYSGLYALSLKKNASISNLPLSNESSWNLSLILKDEILEWTSLSTLIEAFLSTVRDLAGYQKMVGFSLLNLLQKSWYLESWGLLMVFVHIFGGVPILKKISSSCSYLRINNQDVLRRNSLDLLVSNLLPNFSIFGYKMY